MYTLAIKGKKKYKILVRKRKENFWTLKPPKIFKDIKMHLNDLVIRIGTRGHVNVGANNRVP